MNEIHHEMTSFPVTKNDVKTWILSTLGEDERKSAELIVSVVEQHDIDGKLLLLLYKYPHEFSALMSNLRARLLFINAIDVLVKAVGKDLPTSLISSELPTRSLLCRLSSSRFTDRGFALLDNPYSTQQHFSLDEKRSDVPDENLANEITSPLSHPEIKPSHLSLNDAEISDARSEIPSPVPLPVFDHILQQAIHAGRLRERCIRSRLANACARFYVNLKMYPSQLDYHKICERLVQKYPDLRDVEPRPGCQPWGQLKKLLSMAFCNVRRIMKMKDLMNARHIINSIRRRYRGFSKDNHKLIIAGHQQNRSFSDDSSTYSSDGDSSSSVSQRKRLLPSPPPVPTFDPDLQKVITAGRLKDRPWSSQFYRRCAKFYTKLKPYPSRRDYRNISAHLAKVFPDLGHPGHIKHMLSQYIRSHRQSRKLWKLDRQQKARMLTLELSRSKGMASALTRDSTVTTTDNQMPVHASVGMSVRPQASSSQDQIPTSSDYPFSSYDFGVGGSSAARDGNQSTHSPYFNNFGEGRITSQSSETKPSTHGHSHMKPSSPGGSSFSSLTYPVPLPPMDEAMIKGIREGQLQEKNLRNRFIRLCANFYVSLKRYPTKEDYNSVCKTIITEFPDLRDPSPLPGCPPYMLFKKALTACIRNKRRDSVMSSSHSDVSSTQKNPCSIKSERPTDWGYFTHPPTLPPSLQLSQGTEYRESSTVAGFVNISEAAQHNPSVTVYSTAVDLIGRGNNCRTLGSCQTAEAFSHERDSDAGSSYLHSGEGFQSASPADSSPISNLGHIPFPVPLPIFASDLTMLLDSGQPIVGDARISFHQTCSEFYLQMKLFPSRTDFSAICAQLVQTFPQLADPGSIPGRMGFTNLKKELSVHFSNYQQRLKNTANGSKDQKVGSHSQNSSTGLVPVCVGSVPVPSTLHTNHVLHLSAQFFPLTPHLCPNIDTRSTELRTDKPIPYPAPLPRLPKAIQQAIHQGFHLEGQTRSRLLQVCAQFYMSMKYYPNQADYNSICTTLLEAIPVLRSSLADFTNDIKVLKKELSLQIRSLRRRRQQERFCSSRTSYSSSVFREYFNKTPTHEEVEKNITHLKELINELP